VVNVSCSAGAAAVSLNATAGSITSSSFILYGYHVDASNWTGPYQFSWQATQMTSSSAGG
jgi:hypothetical protein